MAAYVLAVVIVACGVTVAIYLVLADLNERRRKRLASWEARTLVGLHTSDVQIQLIYMSKRGREYVMKRQQVGSVYAADMDHDDAVQKLMAKARVRAFEMNVGGN
jgi:peroxiredoxin family protein